jgi:hypothetical protein
MGGNHTIFICFFFWRAQQLAPHIFLFHYISIESFQAWSTLSTDPSQHFSLWKPGLRLTLALATSEDQPIACPEGYADFSYNWTGVAGFPNGGPLSNGQEIGPNIELDAWLRLIS